MPAPLAAATNWGRTWDFLRPRRHHPVPSAPRVLSSVPAHLGGPFKVTKERAPRWCTPTLPALLRAPALLPFWETEP